MRLIRQFATTAPLLLLSIAGHALPIVSVDGGGPGTSCTLGAALGTQAGDTCVLNEVTPHSAWASENPDGLGAEWVSYADTGFGGGELAPRAGSANNADGKSIVMTVTETFTLLGGGDLDFTVWADDTVELLLNGDLQKAANFSQATCANGPIGCESDEFFNLTTALGAGTHTITMHTYQVGTGTNTTSNPFGLLYSGTVTDVPAPAPLLLMGLGILGVVLRRRLATG